MLHRLLNKIQYGKSGHRYPAQSAPQEALTRIQGLLEQLRKEQAGTISDVNETWNGNEGEFSFSAKGFDLSGR
jgi:hypothetical protein